MKRTYVITGPDAAKAAVNCIAAIKFDDIHQVVIEPYDPKRTNAQNDLLHAWLRAVANETGYTVDEVKQIAKREILGVKRVEINGREHDVVPSTAGMGKKEFSEFVDRLIAWAQTNGFVA
jgi:hypothetical protein